jgi:rod shape-determining protein MreD
VTPDSGPGAARRLLTGLVLTAALFAAVALQLTVVNRLPLPGSAAPSLVLLLVTAIAVVTGPAAGAVAGFAGGLMLDVAPPAAHYAGQDALVFCLAGYGAAWAVRALWDHTGERDPLAALSVMAVAAAAGEAGQAALGLLLSDPDITATSATRVLPTAILYDLVLAPFVFLAVSLVTGLIRRAGTAPQEAPVPAFIGSAGLAAVFRAASAGAAPDLRLAGTGGNYHQPPSPRRVPRLQLSGSRAPELARTRAAGSRAPFPVAGGRASRLNFAGDLATGPARGPARKARTPRKDWLRTAGKPAARGGSAVSATRAPSRGWLGPGGQGGSGAGRAPGLTRPRSAASALAARSAPSGVSALSGAGTPLARRSPAPGWLRGSGPTSSLTAGSRRLAPRRGWLGAGGRPRIVIGSGVTGGTAFRRGSIARGNWYTAAPSRAWLRRSRHPWRKRRQRLLRMVGVGR